MRYDSHLPRIRVASIFPSATQRSINSLLPSVPITTERELTSDCFLEISSVDPVTDLMSDCKLSTARQHSRPVARVDLDDSRAGWANDRKRAGTFGPPENGLVCECGSGDENDINGQNRTGIAICGCWVNHVRISLWVTARN